jgi:hypothetical protein
LIHAYSSFDFYSFGDVKSADPALFTGIYTLYLLMPLLVIIRLWKDEPFTKAAPLSSFLMYYGLLNFAVFFSYVLKWFVVHEPGMLPVSVLDSLQSIKSLP